MRGFMSSDTVITVEKLGKKYSLRHQTPKRYTALRDVLGMTRAEIQRKFDEIVDFAEIEKFLDTPVKRYSRAFEVVQCFI
jgi:ABC-type polysaccharide/polyol phosphate transport system ATPase subunit